MEFDRDLMSRQQVRSLVAQAKEASKILATWSQAQIDQLVTALAQTAFDHAEELARLSVEETGFGNVTDKIIKNQFASKTVSNAVKPLKTVGILQKNIDKKVWDIGVPVGVIGAIVPSTNPTSTAIYKAIIALKGANALVCSPHPSAVKCTARVMELLSQSAHKFGCPKGALGCITTPSMEAVNELLHHKDVKLILATGGPTMVQAAYSSGTPAIGVGAGNGPAYVHHTANLADAVEKIVYSKTFDNGVICASEQSVVVESAMESKVVAEMVKQGCHFLSTQEAKILAGHLFRGNGSMNPAIVGKTATFIAKIAGISVPSTTKILVARETGAGMNHPYSQEKLCPVLGFFVAKTQKEVMELCEKILRHEGSGHTFSIHCKDETVVEKFAKAMPVSRFLVNTPAALGGIGATTNLFPALTLGCGAVGGSSSSNNIGPLDLINIRRVAWGVETEKKGHNTVENDPFIEDILEKLCKKLGL
ncbi:MAG: acetaldehyde dehydrogenase (acetylating) [Eubacteriales bacterium]